MDRNWIHFGIAIVGMMCVVLGVVSGAAAFEYVILHEESAEDEGDVSEEVDGYGMFSYEELSEEHQQVVDRAVEGEQYRSDTDDTEAIAWGDGRVVSHDDQYHVITRETAINWTSTAGLLALALGIGGILLTIEAIRRHHYPHYRPFS